jgi:hypothetical protein
MVGNGTGHAENSVRYLARMLGHEPLNDFSTASVFAETKNEEVRVEPAASVSGVVPVLTARCPSLTRGW